MKHLPPALPADLPTSCRCCGTNLDARYQFLGLPNKHGYWQLTCWNKTCSIYGITRTASTYLTFDLKDYGVKETAK